MELYCRATGTNVYEPLIKSTQPEMFVYFESDVSIVNKGFVLYYYAGKFFFNKLRLIDSPGANLIFGLKGLVLIILR